MQTQNVYVHPDKREVWDPPEGLNLTPPKMFVHEHPLYGPFMQAIEQAMHGKGMRHGGASTPFLKQPWRHYAAMHGRGFLTGQAAKKLEEACQYEGDRFEAEILGAMVYLGMAILHGRVADHEGNHEQIA